MRGLLIEGSGNGGRVGDLFRLETEQGESTLLAEVVGIRGGRLLLMPLGDVRGVSERASLVRVEGGECVVVGDHLLGRVVDAMGNPMDGVPLEAQGEPCPIWAPPPRPLERALIEEPLSMGVKVIDSVLTLGRGQRVGVFAGAGVGKSTMIGSILKNSAAEINVIALIGERGREVGEFLARHLGPEGMKRAVVVVSSSDESPPMRMRGAAVATAIAEGFRNRGKSVLLLMDSLTRFAMAAREVGLAAGEPPTTKGYTPSVFASLPKLLERPGVVKNGGSITALYTVLVEGDDMSDPIADAALAILDGHILLSRELAQEGHYPAVDVLKSISRLMNDLVCDEVRQAAQTLRRVFAIYEKNRDLLSIGAYVEGSDPELDVAIKWRPAVREFFAQERDTPWSFDATQEKLTALAQEITRDFARGATGA